MNPRPLCGLCCALLLLALPGCGGGGSSSGDNPSPSAPAAPPSVSAVLPSGLTATLSESAASIPVDGNVTYTVTLTNNTGQPVTFQANINGNASSSAAFAALVTVAGPAGGIPAISGTSAPSGGPVVASSITLTPGQSVAATLVTSGFGAVYPQAGAYSATAVVGLQTSSPTTSGKPVPRRLRAGQRLSISPPPSARWR